MLILCAGVLCVLCACFGLCMSQDVSCLRLCVCVLQCLSGLSNAEVFCMHVCRCVCLII